MKALFSLIFFLLTLTAGGQGLNIEKRGGSNRTTFNRGGMSSFSVETSGKMEVTDDDKDIKSMSPDGYLEITKSVFGNRRTVIITPSGNGLKKEYYEGRTLVDFEPEGRKWLGEILPEILRSTTIAAESRVNRFYRNGGVNAVLNEIRAIDSDYVKHHYANFLVGINQPSQNLAIIVNGVAETIDSDYYLTEFLKDNMRKFLPVKDAMQAVYNSVRNIDSDHYKTEVIKEALDGTPATLENVQAALKATSEMDSDHYKTEVLTNLLRQTNLTDEVIAEMMAATRNMESDHYKTVILTKALAKPGLSSTSFQRALETVKVMESDHYKTEVLTNLLNNSLTPDVQTILITATSSIESDHYITVVGKQILKKVNLSDEAFKNLLEAMSSHQSDYYTAEFLKTAADRPNISKANLLTILQAAGNIESDHYITEVLTQLAPTIRQMNDASLKDAYRATAKKISSETYYGRALRAIE